MRTLLPSDPFMDLSDKNFWVRGQWPAKWICETVHASTEPVVVAFRRRFRLDAAARVRVHVSADERYELFVDGERVGRGSERGDLGHWYFETYDLDLAAGEHVIVARTWWLGPQGPCPFAQFSVRSRFVLASEGAHAALLDTGKAAWECKRLGGYTFLPPGMAWGAGAKVRISGKDASWGFERGEGDGWKPAHAVGQCGNADRMMDGNATWFLSPAKLPPMLDQPLNVGVARHVEVIASDDTTKLFVSSTAHLAAEVDGWNRLLSGKSSLVIPARTRRRVIVDLQDYHTAYPELTVSGGKGSSVRIHWAEGMFVKESHGYGPKGNRDEIDGKLFEGIGDAFEPDGGRTRRFESLWWESGRYLEVVVMTADDALTIDALRLRETHYPFQWDATFSSSDPRLAAVMVPAIRTLEACSHETYMDCPYYEQLMYVGDTRLEVLVTYAMTRDARLPRKAIELFDQSRDTSGLTQSRYPSFAKQMIPPFSLWWVCMVHDYAMWRGEPAFVRARLLGVRSVIDAFCAFLNADGLVEAPHGWNFMDWVPSWKNGMPLEGDTGVSGPLNWQFALTLRLAASLEDMVGDPEQAARCRRLADRLSAAIDVTFWDERRGLYADDRAKTTFSEHAQCLALIGGNVPPARRPRVESGLLADADLARTTIYFSHYLFETYRMLGRTDLIIGRMDLWFSLGGLGLHTTLEAPEPSRSDCHAWGAHPLHHYFASILGIRPATFGFATVRIEPKLGPLAWAKGTLAHPQGVIEADLRASGAAVTGTVTLPHGVSGTFVQGTKVISLKPGLNSI